MKFIHTADVHLGATPDAEFEWSQDRGREIWEALERLVKRVDTQGADLLLIAGDLFHRQPLMRELKEVNYLFSTLRTAQVVLLAGNHDFLKPDSYYWKFPWCENVHFLYGEGCESVYLPQCNTRVYGLSYHSREITEPLYDSLRPQEDGSCSILLAHGGDSRHIPIDKRRLASSGFDYIALGHIHKPQVLIPDKMQYAGALEALDKEDTGVHGFVEGEIRDGQVRTWFIPNGSREYKELKIMSHPGDTSLSLEQAVREQIKVFGEKHQYKITLTGFRDPDIIYDIQRYEKLGRVVEVKDETEPDYDFEALVRQYKDGIISQYIKRLKGEKALEELDEIQRRALYYGVQALLETKE